VETLEGLLATVGVGEPEFHVARLGPGPASLPTGSRWSLVTVARGRVDALGTTLGPGDAALARGRGAAPVRTAGDHATVLVARFALHGPAHHLGRLPDDVVVRADSELCRPLVERLVDQIDGATTGDAVSTRLLDWLVVSTVRDGLAEAPAAVADVDVTAALAAIHERPAEPWTVAGLARVGGVGRAAFARRFRDAVGTPPLAYVREHRLDLAERALLAEPDTTIAAVARRVGYASPFSFSTAFRRHRGVAPSELRAAAV
jgi:AraC-like DNA-binding protein